MHCVYPHSKQLFCKGKSIYILYIVSSGLELLVNKKMFSSVNPFYYLLIQNSFCKLQLNTFHYKLEVIFN